MRRALGLNKLGIDLNKRGGGSGIPFDTDLLADYNKIVGIDYSERISDNDGEFMPRVADFNGSDDVASKTVANFLGSATSGSVKVMVNSNSSDWVRVFSSPDNSTTSKYYSCEIVFGKPRISIRGTITNNYITDNAISNGWHEIEYISDGSNYDIKVDGISVDGAISDGTDDGKWFSYVTNRDSIDIGGILDSSPSYSVCQIAWVKIDDGTNGYWICNGTTDFIYDISALANHLTITGTGSHYDFDKDASLYPKTSGYSLWEHATSDPIQVPFDVNGTALSLTAGVNIPTGYTKTRDISGSLKHNLAEALVDFDPTDATPADLDTLDRSNATIQTADSRASIWYDSDNPYRYHIKEIADPRTYSRYFNTGYKGLFFSKVQTALNGSIYDIVRLDENIIYATDKVNTDEWKVMKWGNLDDFALRGADGEGIVDGDGYVILNPEGGYVALEAFDFLTANYAGTQMAIDFQLPVGKSIRVYWGDGSFSTVDGNDTTDVQAVSTYATNAAYQVRLTGDIADITLIDTLTSAVGGSISEWYMYLGGLTSITVNTNNTLSGSIANLTSLTYINVLGSNTVSGSIAGLTLLTYLRIEGSNTVSGSIAGLTSLTSLNIQGSNTISGSITALTSLVNIFATGSNTLSGSITGLTSLTNLYIKGLNTVSGDLNPIVSDLITWCHLNPCQMVAYTSGATWTDLAGGVTIIPSVSYGYDSTEIDNILIDIAASDVMSGKTITLTGSSAARTAASDAAVTKLETTDSGYVHVANVVNTNP